MLIWLPVSVGQRGLSHSYVPPADTSTRASWFHTSALLSSSMDELGEEHVLPGRCSSVNPALIDFYMNHWLKGLLFLPPIKMP